MRNVRALFGAQTAALLAITLFSVSVQAAPLTGSGAHLGVPAPNPGPPIAQSRTLSNVTASGFTGSWSPPALSAWLGSYSATGPVPNGPTTSGFTQYDFSGLTNGVLPSGTFFVFTDVDAGASVVEQFELQAFDGAGLAITSAWLDEPIGASGITTGTGAFLPSDMPGWSFNAGLYTFDGTTVAGNPSVNIFLPSNVDITTLSVFRASTPANFLLQAPIPTPGSAVVIGLGGIALLRRRR